MCLLYSWNHSESLSCVPPLRFSFFGTKSMMLTRIHNTPAMHSSLSNQRELPIFFLLPPAGTCALARPIGNTGDAKCQRTVWICRSGYVWWLDLDLYILSPDPRPAAGEQMHCTDSSIRKSEVRFDVSNQNAGKIITIGMRCFNKDGSIYNVLTELVLDFCSWYTLLYVHHITCLWGWL